MRIDDAGPRTWLLAGVAGWALVAWLLAVAGMGGRVEPLPDDPTLLQPRFIMLDPSAASFHTQLHEDLRGTGLAPWAADNDVLKGIGTIGNLLDNALRHAISGITVAVTVVEQYIEIR